MGKHFNPMHRRDRSSSEDGVSLGQAEVIADSGKALRVSIAGETSPRWIPQSVIHDESEVFAAGGTGDLVVKQWWAEKEGLI